MHYLEFMYLWKETTKMYTQSENLQLHTFHEFNLSLFIDNVIDL